MKVLVAFYTSTGKTETMAEYIAEGVRITGNEADVRKIGDLKDPAELAGYDGLIFGSPTFSLDAPHPMKSFLSRLGKGLEGKSGGAFGAYAHDVGYEHDTHAPAIILDLLEKEHKMKPFELGPFALKEDMIGTDEGRKACQDYGRVFAEKLGA